MRKGFGMIELMLVITIVGILLAITIPAYQDYQTRAPAASGERTKAQGYYLDRHEFPEDGVVCYVAKSKHSDRHSIACVDVMP